MAFPYCQPRLFAAPAEYVGIVMQASRQLTDLPLSLSAADTARELHSVLLNLAASFGARSFYLFKNVAWLTKAFSREYPQFTAFLLRIAMSAPLNDGCQVNLNPRWSWFSQFWRKCSNDK